jgi:hypothetical protein
LTPGPVITTYFVVGLIFIPLGVVFYQTSANVRILLRNSMPNDSIYYVEMFLVRNCGDLIGRDIGLLAGNENAARFVNQHAPGIVSQCHILLPF